MKLPAGLVQKDSWRRPRGHAYPAEPGVTVYQGKIAVRCKLEGRAPPGTKTLTASIGGPTGD